ncbi:MAG: hypothetical protein HYZ42_09820, partial [Bacteroidetes bacterium]|nr:hypothetical protein [Bacteroidota bacterium]
MTKKNSVQASTNMTPFWAIAIFVLAILLYTNTFNHGFVFDDLTQIEQNALVQKGSKAVPELLTTSYRHGYDGQNSGLYRPLSNVMFALEFEKVGMKARLFHIDNVIIYALICLLLYLAFAKFLHRFHPGWAIAAAVLYTVHPIHTEVVANIKSRDELLNTLGLAISLLCLATYILKPKNIYIVVALLGYTFSLFSKESSITFLAIFP